MYHRATLNVAGGVLFYRRTRIDPQRLTLLFLHGLGDSGQAFREAFGQAGLRAYNLVVPDLPGYGKSSPAADEDYCFHRQITRLYQLIDSLGIEEFAIVGHSMGGDIGTLMCANDRQGRIPAVVNIEGDLTAGDRFITDRAIAAEKAGDFEFWLRHCFTDEIVPSVLKDYKSTQRRYRAALRLCETYAFLQNCKEIYALNEDQPPHRHGIIASIFDSLPVQKVFFWASESLSNRSQAYLQHKPYSHTPPFENSSHWIMLDKSREFYDTLSMFLSSVEGQRSPAS
jgi:pimeloyl-ACP methyl ester carboxylesterase